jgi:predicted O-methyltransferase YrrM
MKPIDDPQIEKVLRRLEAEDAEDRRLLNRPREERMFTLHPDTSRLLRILIQSTGAQQLVEIGVAYGYSTIWLAHVSRLVGGRLSSLEINPKLIEIARQNVEEAGLSAQVDFVLGDARQTIETVAEPFDFVLLDCWEWLYVEMLDILAPRLRPGALLVADNVHPGQEDSDRFVEAVERHPLFEAIGVPIGRDIQVCMRKLGS